MRHSDELEEIFKKYWDRMSEKTRHLAKETVKSARGADAVNENSGKLISLIDEEDLMID
jgi:hypothetical protein